MPLDPEIIFKLTIDDSGYIVGVNNMTATTQKFVDAQRKANLELIKSQNALATATTNVADLTAELDKAKATNDANAVADLTAKLQTATDAETNLTAEVLDRKAAYDAATKSAQDFFDVEQKAPGAAALPTPGTTVQQQQLDLFQPPVLPAAGTQLDLGFQVDGIQAANEAVQELQQSLQDLKDIKEQALAAGEDQTSPQFVELNQLIAGLEQQLQLYNKTLTETGNVAQETGQKHISLRTQLLNLRNEMAALTEAGKENTAEFRAVAEEAGHLTRVYREQQERLRFLSAENKVADFGKAAVQGAIGVFQTFTSVSVLLGEKNDELEKQTLKLFAAMQLLTGIEEVLTLTRRSSTVAIGIQTAATTLYTTVVGAATGATKALRIALLSTGIGAVVAGLAFLVTKFIQLQDAQKKANAEAKITNEINEKAVDGYAKQVASLEILKRQLTDLSLSEARRVELAKEYNKTAEDGNKINIDQINNTDQLTAAINRQEEAIRARSTAAAAEAVTTEKASTVLVDKLKTIEEAAKAGTETKFNKQGVGAITNIITADDLSTLDKAAAKLKDIQAQIKISLKTDDNERTTALENTADALQKLIADFGDYNSALKLAAQLTANLKPPETFAAGSAGKAIEDKKKEIEQLEQDKLNAQFSEKTNDEFNAKIEKAKKELQVLEGKKVTTAHEVTNTFLTQQAELNKQLAELESSSITTAESISKKFEAKLQEEKTKLAQEVKKGSITQEQSGILLEIFLKINEEQKNQELDKLSKEIFEAQQKITDEINTLQTKAQTDTINNIQDEFTKRAALIEQNELNERVIRKKSEDKAIEDLNEAKRIEQLTDFDYYRRLHEIITAGETESTAITVKFAQQRHDLAVAIFKDTLDQYQQAFRDINSTINRDTAEFVSQKADQFLGGKINFTQFKEQTEKFTREQSIKDRQNTIEANKQRIAGLTLGLIAEHDTTSKTYKAIYKERQELTDQTNKLIVEEKNAEVDAKQKEKDEKVKAINDYASAIGNVATSVIGFWQAANAAEAAALDRSIALQQRRVDEAQRIADKGNAQYLKSETDRLKQLEVERENSARRQLGIDAALQASQILVGITGAIAKISTGIGAAETIAEIAVIVGALATGYGLVKQLQANQPRLAEGTPYVQRGPNPAGTDTIPAWLNEGEAVIPTERNRKYSTAVKAIYDEKIPADVLNSFVSKYSKKSDTKKEVTVVDKVLKGETITSDFINTVSKKDFDEKSKLVYTLQNLTKRFIGQDHDKAFLSTLKADEVKSYNEIITKSIESHVKENKAADLPSQINSIVYRAINPKEKSVNQKTYESFVRNINRAPEKTVKEFIKNYEHSEVTRAVKETAKQVVKKESLKDNSILKILPVFPSINYNLKPVPQPNYEHIQTVNEMKLGQDGKLRAVAEEQNALLRENNEHQKETQRLLKSMGVNVKIDEEGVSAMVMKAIEQKKIYSKI